jgi:hypothetical protein
MKRKVPTIDNIIAAEADVRRIKKKIATIQNDQEKVLELILLMRAERRLASEHKNAAAYLSGEGSFFEEERPQNTKLYRRWSAVVEARREGVKRKPKDSWKDAYKAASKHLVGKRYRGGAATMKRDYQIVQGLLKRQKWVNEMPPDI